MVPLHMFKNQDPGRGGEGWASFTLVLAERLELRDSGMGCPSSASPPTEAVKLAPHFLLQGFLSQEPLCGFNHLDIQSSCCRCKQDCLSPAMASSLSWFWEPVTATHCPLSGPFPLTSGTSDPTPQRNLSHNGLPEACLSVAQEEIPSLRPPQDSLSLSSLEQKRVYKEMLLGLSPGSMGVGGCICRSG